MITFKQDDDGRKGRFVIYENNQFAGEMTYTWAGNTMFIIDHTGIEQAFGGKGFGKRLVLKAVDFARNQNVKILPLCPFAKAEFDKNTDLQDVLM